jgi:NADH dehydrogenase (ubiquinone) 1 alpha subcomplex subunit 5
MRPTPLLRSIQVLVRTARGTPTGLTGIFQHPDPRPALIEIYRSTIRFLKDEFPEHSVYRNSTLAFTKERLAAVESTEDIGDIEQKIGNGLLEEVLIQASEEFSLAELLKREECWDNLSEEPLEDQWVYFGKKL